MESQVGSGIQLEVMYQTRGTVFYQISKHNGVG